MRRGMKRGAKLRILRSGVGELDLLFAVVRQAQLDIHFERMIAAEDVPPAEFLSEFLADAIDTEIVIVPQRRAPARHRCRWHVN